MKKTILFFSMMGVLILSGCKKDFFNSKELFICTTATMDKLLNSMTHPEKQTSLIKIEEKKVINNRIHKSNAASSATEFEKKIDSIINQIGDLP